MSAADRSQKLLALVDLVTQSAHAAIEEWHKEELSPEAETTDLPSWELHNAQRTIIAACGAITDLVHDPQLRIFEVAAGFLEARALHVATEHRVADILDKHGGGGNRGVPIDALAEHVGIDDQKLVKLMRVLTSLHIFAEVEEGRFANNRTSSALVRNEPLRALVMIQACEIYDASQKLPEVLRDPVIGRSVSPSCTAMTKALGTDLTLWEWFEEQVPQPDGSLGPRPELERFALAMIGNGQAMNRALYYDYPWASLGKATIVDVGGGVGGMCVGLSRLYGDLVFVVQDRPQVLDKARAVWHAESPGALERGAVTFMPHDFFKPSPIQGADVYFLRCILHDWQDEQCVEILKAIRVSMGPASRILVADQVMNSTVGCAELASAPAPLPANYGVYTRTANEFDVDMMMVTNSTERTPAQLRRVAESAELEVTKIWECRGLVWITELRLPA